MTRGADAGTGSARAFQALVAVTGAVATAAGLDTSLRGARSFPGVGGTADAATESEARFFGGIYLAFGLTTLARSRHADTDVGGVRQVAGTFLVAGLARARSWHEIGRPRPSQQALLAAELVLPVVLVVWQDRLQRSLRSPRTPTA